MQNAHDDTRAIIEAVFDTVAEALLVLDEQLRVVAANRAFYATFRVEREHTEKRPIAELGDGQWNTPELRQALAEFVETERGFEDLEVCHDFPAIGTRVMRLTGRRMRPTTKGPLLILLSIEDITSLAHDRARLRETRWVVDNSPDIIARFDPDGRYLFVNHAFERLTGKTSAQVSGRHLGEFGSPQQSTGNIIDAMQRAAASGAEQVIEAVYGSTTFQVHVVPEKDEAGRAISLITYSRDITSLKKAEEALQTNRKLLATIINSIPVMITLYDPQIRSVTLNKAFESITGWREEEINRHGLMELCFPDPALRDSIRRHMQSLQPGWRDMPLTCHDGHAIDSLWANVGLPDGRQVGIGIDISERKQMEEQLRRNEERLRAVFQTVSEGIAIIDMSGRIVLVNDAEAAICGFPDSESMQREIDFFTRVFELRTLAGELIPVEQWPVSRVLRGESVKDLEVRGRRRDTGQQWFFSYSGGPVRIGGGRQILAVVITRDITARKLDEQALAQSREDLKRAQAVGHIGSWRINLATNELSWSEEAYRIFGVAPATPLTYATFLAIVHPEDREYVDRKWQAALQYQPYDIEHRIIVGQQVKWVRENAELEFDRAEALVSAFGIVQDITELHNRTLQAEEGKRVLEALMAYVPEGITIATAPDMRITMVSRYGQLLLGGPHAGTEVGQVARQWKVYRADSQTLLSEEELPLVRAIRRGEIVRDFELIEISSSGQRLYLLCNAAPLRDEEGAISGGIVVWRDITGRKQSEDELHKRTEELLSLNKELEAFSYSVSHDLRNPLRAIKGFSDILREDCTAQLDETCRGYLERIDAGVERMNSIIDDMLVLSRIARQETAFEQLDVSDMARLSIDELRSSQPDRRAAVHIQPGLHARADARLMSVALSNLLGNAWKYTSRTADAVIEFGAFDRDGERIFFVKDNGAGFDMAQAERLFIPFQRLHSAREFAGTGIGLAIVERAIKRHNGRIWAQAEVGKGATFYFTLGSDATG
jgi:PAS domain S-box-containing protein